MKFSSTFRNFNGSVYIRIPSTIEDNWKLKKLIERYEKEGKKPECIIEDIIENKLIITVPVW